MTRFLYAIAACLRSCLPALGVLLALLSASPPSRAATEYSVANGLSQNSVLAMVQDAEGFVWIATEDGLNRFDGYEFRVYRPSEALGAGAAANYIADLAIQDPYLFLASNGGGLLVFDRRDGRFRHLGAEQGLLAEHLTAVETTGPGSLLLASRGGLERLSWEGDPMQAEFRVERLADQPEHAGREFWELHASSSGQWVGSGDGVFRIDSNGELLAVPVQGTIAPFNTDAFLESPAGVLWIGSWDQGLFRVRLDTGEARQFLPGQPQSVGLRSSRILSLAAGPDGVVFVGTDQGLAWFDPSCDCLRVLNHRRAARLAGRGFLVKSLLADQQGGVFAGYWGEGLVRFTPQDRAFHVESYRDEGPAALNHHRVRAILESRTGDLWLGTFGGGLQRVRGERRLGEPWRFESVPFSAEVDVLPMTSRLVWALLEARDGRLWAGTDDGLYLREVEGGPWQREQPLGIEVPMAGVRVLADDARGRLWVGSSSGLGRIEPGGLQRERISLATPEVPLWRRRQIENIQSLYVDTQQRVWVGSWSGLAILDENGNTLARYGVEHGLPAPIVWDIHRHTDGSVWLATNGGLVRVENPESPTQLVLRAVGRDQGLPYGPALGLVSDRSGHLWITTNRGLLRYEPRGGALRLFTRAQGIAADEFATQAEAVGRNGWLYFGGIDGLTSFDPATLPEALELPRPRLSDLRIDDEAPRLQTSSQAGVGRLRLPHAHAPLILDFTGLVFNQPEAVRYRYRLRQNESFVDLGTRRSLILDHLPAGTSRLELEVDNLGSRAQTTLVEFEVVPPWTSSWVFRGTALLAALLVLAALYVWRVRALTRQRSRLERLVSERTRELRRQKEALEATALALGEANQRFKQLSLQDPLTGLCNRRSLIERLQREFARESGARPALLMIDLDHFKRINDTLGHRAGDAVLRDFAELLSAEVPDQGVVGRWGGEEFLCLLPASPPEFAWQWAERLLARVRERRVQVAGQVLEYRASAGLAFAAPSGDIDASLALADGALYAAKSAGRDCLRQA